MSMDLLSIIEAGGNVKLEVSSRDLTQFAEAIIEKACRMREYELEKKKEETCEEFLSSQEVCEKFHICTTTLWQWGKTGYLVPYKHGKKKRYALVDVNRVMKDRGGNESATAYINKM